MTYHHSGWQGMCLYMLVHLPLQFGICRPRSSQRLRSPGIIHLGTEQSVVPIHSRKVVAPRLLQQILKSEEFIRAFHCATSSIAGHPCRTCEMDKPQQGNRMEFRFFNALPPSSALVRPYLENGIGRSD